MMAFFVKMWEKVNDEKQTILAMALNPFGFYIIIVSILIIISYIFKSIKTRSYATILQDIIIKVVCKRKTFMKNNYTKDRDNPIRKYKIMYNNFEENKMSKKINIGCLIALPFLGMVGIFPMVGLIITIIGISMTLKTNEMAKNYLETVGYYKDYIYSYKDEDGTPLYNLEYEYTVNGDQYRVQTNYVTSNIPNYGQEKKVKYNPENPNEAIIDGFGVPSIMIITGSGFILLSCIWIIPIIIMNRKMRKNRKSKNENLDDTNIKYNGNIDDNDDFDPIKTR